MKRPATFSQFLAAVGLAGSLALAGCASESPTGYVNALSGEECVPDESYRPRDARPDRGNRGNNGNGNESPTGIPGDNMDDTRSGKVDCLGDGNSGQGDDKKHNCEFPPGCDDNGCCDDDDVPPPGDGDGDGDDDDVPPPGDGDGDGDDDDVPPPGGDGDGDNDTPIPPADECPAEDVCTADADCGAESVCADNCCVTLIE